LEIVAILSEWFGIVRGAASFRVMLDKQHRELNNTQTNGHEFHIKKTSTPR